MFFYFTKKHTVKFWVCTQCYSEDNSLYQYKNYHHHLEITNQFKISFQKYLSVYYGYKIVLSVVVDVRMNNVNFWKVSWKVFCFCSLKLDSAWLPQTRVCLLFSIYVLNVSINSLGYVSATISKTFGDVNLLIWVP